MAEIAQFRASLDNINSKPGDGAKIRFEVPETEAHALTQLMEKGGQKVLVITVEEEQPGMFG